MPGRLIGFTYTVFAIYWGHAGERVTLWYHAMQVLAKL